jgi:hypothetical protein
MAIACFREVTLAPLLLRSVPFFRLVMARLTERVAASPYALLDFDLDRDEDVPLAGIDGSPVDCAWLPCVGGPDP